MLTNFCLEEYCNIGYMEGISDSLQLHPRLQYVRADGGAVLSQWQEKYPGKEWENQLAPFDKTLYMGCNDMTVGQILRRNAAR